jgi:SAM-dependent methyltransferase
MSALNKAFRFFSRFTRTTVQEPGRTIAALNQLSAVVQGEQFSSRLAPPQNVGTSDADATRLNPLLNYFNNHKEGPGIWKWEHYFDIYERHFRKFVGREVHVLEVGIYSGGSLQMWKEYFGPQCHIYGVDIEEACLAYRGPNVDVFIGDQEDRSFWARVRQSVPRVDILIDDGGHHPEQQRITLEEMFPHLAPGGIYLCEDIHGSPNRFASFLQGFLSGLNSVTRTAMPPGIDGVAIAPAQVQQVIEAMHFYPFVAVIEKRTCGMAQLIAPKHGTQWQPFL